MRAPTPRRRPVDWAAVHARLDALRASLAQGVAPSPAQAQAVLRARARALAAPLGAPPCSAPLEVIEFALGGEAYAFETAWVAEVFPLAGLAALPGTPPFVLGIVHLRGDIVSVVDLRAFFDLPVHGLADRDHVILLQSPRMVFGVLAERVSGVRTVDAARLQDGPPTLADRRRDYLKGIAEARLVVLDAAALLADPRMVVDQEVGS